jgi:hypothetical protein
LLPSKERSVVCALDLEAFAGLHARAVAKKIDGTVGERYSEEREAFLNGVDFADGYPPHHLALLKYPAAWNTRMIRQMGSFMYDIELAIVDSLLKIDPVELSRSMIGTTKVPIHIVERKQSWGETCNRFLDAVQAHKSKASGGYYLRTHLDYFDKMHRSMVNITDALRKDGFAIMILQDSYYKDVHNDVPQIISEIAAGCGLDLPQRGDFKSPNCMSRINSRSPSRENRTSAVESVLVFRKSG